MRILIVSLEHDGMRSTAESVLVSHIAREAAEPHHAQVDISVIEYFSTSAVPADDPDGEPLNECPLVQYIYDPHTGYFDVHAKAKFASLDAVILVGQGKSHAAPWNDELGPLNVFLRECMKASKPVLASGLAFLSVCYICSMAKAAVSYVGDSTMTVVNPFGDRLSDILSGNLTYSKTNLSKAIMRQSDDSSQNESERNSLTLGGPQGPVATFESSSGTTDTGSPEDERFSSGADRQSVAERHSSSSSPSDRSSRALSFLSLSRSMSTIIPSRQYVLDAGSGDLYTLPAAERLTLSSVVSSAVMNVGVHGTLIAREYTSGAMGRVVGINGVVKEAQPAQVRPATKAPALAGAQVGRNGKNHMGSSEKSNQTGRSSKPGVLSGADSTVPRIRPAPRQFVSIRSSECVCDVLTVHPSTHSRCPLAAEMLSVGKYDSRSFTVPFRLEWECNDPIPWPLQALASSHSKGPVILNAGSLLATAFPIDAKYPFTAHVFQSFMKTVSDLCRTGDLPTSKFLADICYMNPSVPPISNLQKQMLGIHLSHVPVKAKKSIEDTMPSVNRSVRPTLKQLALPKFKSAHF